MKRSQKYTLTTMEVAPSNNGGDPMLTWTRHEPKHGSVYYTASHDNYHFTVKTYAPSTPAIGWWYMVNTGYNSLLDGGKYGTAQEAMDAVGI